jgi:hypothetical protein
MDEAEGATLSTDANGKTLRGHVVVLEITGNYLVRKEMTYFLGCEKSLVLLEEPFFKLHAKLGQTPKLASGRKCQIPTRSLFPHSLLQPQHNL